MPDKAYQGEMSQPATIGCSKFKGQYQSLIHTEILKCDSACIARPSTRKMVAIFAARTGQAFRYPLYVACFFISGEFGGMEGCSM